MTTHRTRIASLLFCAAIIHAAELKFVDVTGRAGLLEPLAGLMGHGGAWGDFDGDGRIDLFVGGFCDRPNAEYAPANNSSGLGPRFSAPFSNGFPNVTFSSLSGE